MQPNTPHLPHHLTVPSSGSCLTHLMHPPSPLTHLVHPLAPSRPPSRSMHRPLHSVSPAQCLCHPVHTVSHVHPRFLPPLRIHSHAVSPASLTPCATSPTLVSSRSPCHPPVKRAWDATDIPWTHLTWHSSQEARPRSNEKSNHQHHPYLSHECTSTHSPWHPLRTVSPIHPCLLPTSHAHPHAISPTLCRTRSPRCPLRAVSPIHPCLSPTLHNHPHAVSPTGIPCYTCSPRRLLCAASAKMPKSTLAYVAYITLVAPINIPL